MVIVKLYIKSNFYFDNLDDFQNCLSMTFLCVNNLTRRFMSSCAAKNINLSLVKKELVSIWEFEKIRYGEYEDKYTHETSEYFDTVVPRWNFMDKEMSSNVAGETGAVWIYKGALTATKYRSNCEEVEAFARQHMATEQQHLDYMLEIVPTHMHTRLLNLWKFCGFMLGFIPTILGKGPALYHTVDAVETFVETHYNEQIEWLQDLEKENPEIFIRAKGYKRQLGKMGEDDQNSSELIRVLSLCCEDEVEHKLDAKRRLLGLQQKEKDQEETGKDFPEPSYGVTAKIWRAIVNFGSASAAELARHI